MTTEREMKATKETLDEDVRALLAVLAGLGAMTVREMM
jgi:hypothetical protein